MNDGLDGRVIAISGGARGIGRATAAALLEPERALRSATWTRLSREAASEVGRGTVGLELDVTDRSSLQPSLTKQRAA